MFNSKNKKQADRGKKIFSLNNSGVKVFIILLLQVSAMVNLFAFNIKCDFEKNPEPMLAAKQKAFSNPGEVWDFDGTPFRFTPWEFLPTGNAKVRWITGKAGTDTHSGEHSLYVKQLGKRTPHFVLYKPVVKSASLMTGSLYCKGKGAIELRLYLYKNGIRNESIQTIKIDSRAWKKIVFDDFFASPEKAKHARIVLAFHGEIWCDDIVFKDVDKDMVSAPKLSSGVPLPPGAKIVFEENFNSPEALKQWNSCNGNWKIKDNALYTSGKEAYIVCKKNLGKNLRVEYTAWTNENSPYDLSAVLNAYPDRKKWRPVSYYLAFGSSYNRLNFIFARGKIIERNDMILAGNAESGVVPGKHHRIIAQKDGNTLTLFADGKKLLETQDMFSGKMTGESFGFFFHTPGYIDDIKVYSLPDNCKGETMPELKPEISLFSGFDTPTEQNFPYGFDINNAQAVKRTNIPTWIYREKEKKAEKYVTDNCLVMTPGNNSVNIVKPFKPVKSGIIEFDLMGRDLGENGISVSLLGKDKQIVSTFFIDKDGSYYAVTKSGKKKLRHEIEYLRRTTTAPFFFRKNRWYTLRVAFDCKAGTVQNIAVINLFTPMRYYYSSSMDKSKGEFYSLGGSLPFTRNTPEITGISIQPSIQSNFCLDNLCIVGPVGNTFVNGKDRRNPLRTLLNLSFPERKDPFDVKMLSLRNLHNTRTKYGRKSCYSGYSYFLVCDKNLPLNKSFNEAADRYNKLLVRHGFLKEKQKMLMRIVCYLKDGVQYDLEQSGRVEKALQEMRRSDELLQEAYQAYALAFVDNLNSCSLTKGFSPATDKLEQLLDKAEELYKNVLENLPGKSVADNVKVIPSPSPVPLTSPVWENGQWCRNGKPCFYYYTINIDPRIAKVLRFLPIDFVLPIERMPLGTGKYINVPYCRERYNELSHNKAGAKFYFNMQVGLHLCEFEIPRWWLEKYSKEDQDIFFFDAEDHRPQKGAKYLAIMKFYQAYKTSKRSAYISLNFWNENVRKMLAAKFDAFSRAMEKYFKDNFTFYVLGWEAANCGPREIETGHNPSAKKAFHEFLKKEYKDIDELNKKWGSEYKAFTAINPPQKTQAPSGVQYEFQRFRQAGYKSWMDICRESIKKNMPDTPVVFDINKTMLGFRKDGFDVPTFFKMTDIAAFHIYTESNRKPNDRLLDSARKACGGTIGNNEWSVEQCCPEMFLEDVLKNNGLQNMFHRMMWGQGMSVVSYADTPGDWLDSVSTGDPRLGTLLLRYHSTYIPILMDRERRFGQAALQAPSVQPDVAILEATSSFYNALPAGVIRKEMADIAVTFEKNHYNYGFLYEQLLLEKKQSLTGIQAIVIVNGTCLPNKLAEQLTDWIKAGGTLICLAPVGVYNQYGQPAGGLLQQAFPGVTWTHDKLYNWAPEDKNIPVPLKTFSSVNLYSAKLGKGKLYMTSRTDTNKEVWNFIADDIIGASLHRSYYSNEGKFDLCMRELNGKNFLYVLNPSLYDVTEDEIIIQGAIKRLIDKGMDRPLLVPFKHENGKTVFKMRLAPAEGTLLEFEKETEK